MLKRMLWSRLAIATVAVTLAACSDKSNTEPAVAVQPAAIQIVSGLSQVATVNTAAAQPVVAHVVDASGNPMAGIAVSFSTGAASGTVSSATATTDSSGNASVVWTLGTHAGTDSLVATVGSLSASTSAVALPDAPASMAVTAGDQQLGQAGEMLPTPLTVTVTDHYGNLVPNAVIQWSSDNGSLASTITVTDANGVATNYATPGSAGTDDVTAQIVVAGSVLTASFTEMGN